MLPVFAKSIEVTNKDDILRSWSGGKAEKAPTITGHLSFKRRTIVLWRGQLSGSCRHCIHASPG